MKVLVFDISGKYAHYKKIYATTSAVSYVIPTKTSLYGYVGAIIGLDKNNNEYLRHFGEKKCLIGIELRRPIIMQRINTNLRAGLGRMRPTDNRKPTTVEYVYEPEYRIYFTHEEPAIYDRLKIHLQTHTTVYTPTLGLSNLLSNFSFVGEYDMQSVISNVAVPINSVIPRRVFKGFDDQKLFDNENEVIEQSLYAVEMDIERNVTERDDIFLDRKAKPITAFVSEYYSFEENNVILF
jgi:CRISPR-associated protein Cas5h